MNKGLIIRTPLIPFERGRQIYLKPENLQPFGSYKLRGVLSAIQSAPTSLVEQGLSAASAGNMAQSVAYIAQTLKVNCKIYVPNTTPEIKKLAIQNLGATLIECPFDQVWDMVRLQPSQRRSHGLFIHPVFTPGLLDGYKQIAEEILSDLPDTDAVVVPFGVGGLTLGLGQALKAKKPKILIYACEPETAAPLHASLLAGRPMSVLRTPSFVDAIGTPEVLPEVFEQIKDIVTESLVVSLKDVRSAVSTLAIKHKLICEGAAAASLAAGLKLSKIYPEMKITCILTGGNIAPHQLYECHELSTNS